MTTPDSNDSRVIRFRAMLARKEKTDAELEAEARDKQKEEDKNNRMRKMIVDWEKNARMQGFIRQAPVPLPPTFPGGPGVYTSPKKRRRLSNFIPSVDTTSIYEMQDPKTPKKTPQNFVHKLHKNSQRPDDFVSPETLPENLQRKKVSLIKISRINPHNFKTTAFIIVWLKLLSE